MDRQKYMAICAICLAIFLAAGPLLSPRWSPVPKAHASSIHLTLYGQLMGWNYSYPPSNPTITVTQGETVSITLIGVDSTHRFLLDLDGNGANLDCPGPDICSSDLSYGQTVNMAPFSVNTTGSYTYFCYYHSVYMRGTFDVLPAGPDYSVSSGPSSLIISQGSKANSTVSVTSLHNFMGSVTLSTSISSPPGIPISSFNVNPVTVASGGTGKSNFTISVPVGTNPGSYTITVTGKNSTTFSHSTTISVTVPMPDFSLVTSPVALTIISGNSGTSTLMVTGSNGFSGTVNLATSVPSGRGSASLSQSSVTLSPSNPSATSIVTVSSPVGAFNATIRGTSGVSHSTELLVKGPDFGVTSASKTLSVAQGSSATLKVTLSSLNGFAGTVTLSASSSHGAPPVTISPASLQVPPSGSVDATITVTASSSGAYSTPVSTGNYVITVNASMGSLSHVETIPLTVVSTPSVIDLTNPIVIGGVAAAVLGGIVVYALIRRSKK